MERLAGTGNDTTNPTTVIMSGNKNITVTFNPRFSLTVSNQTVIGAVVIFPEGSVAVSPAPGDDDKYAYGTKITLTANPNTGYGWKYWSGTGSDTSNPATVTINSEKHVAVTFEARYLVTINNQALAGSSLSFTGGSVSANPAPGRTAGILKIPSPCLPPPRLRATASTGGAGTSPIESPPSPSR